MTRLIKFAQTMGDLLGDPVETESDRVLGRIANLWRNFRRKLNDLLAIPGLWSQVYTAMALSVPAFAAGTVEGWPGSMSLKLPEPETAEWFGERPGPDFPIGKVQISGIYFTMMLSALIHMAITGVLMDRLGRKAGCWFILFLAPCGWLFLATSQDFHSIYVGAPLIGSIAVSGEIVGVVYISEISSDKIRGPLISLVMFFNSLGIFAAHVLGEELPFSTFHYICLAVTMVFPFVLWHLPESPQYLVLKSRMVEARKSVAWFHGNDPIIMNSEMKKLESARKFDFRDCKTIMGSISNRRAAIIATGLSVMTELSGTSIVEVFAGSTISQIRQAPISAKIASIVLASCRFIGGILNVYFVERSGRKSILIVSLLSMATSLAFLGVILRNTVDSYNIPDFDLPFLYPNSSWPDGNHSFYAFNNFFQNMIDQNDPHFDKSCIYIEVFTRVMYVLTKLRQITFYASTVCLVIYTLSNQMFMGTTEVISGEILSADTKGIMMAVCGFARLSTLLICVTIYNFALVFDDFAWWNIIFNCVCCWLGAHLAYHHVPETQGKTLHEIHRKLGAKQSETVDAMEQD